MATDKLWDAFINSLDVDQSDKYSDFIEYLDTNSYTLLDLLSKSQEQVSDLFKDYGGGATNSTTNNLKEKISEAIDPENSNSIDPCAPREKLESLFYSRFSSQDSGEIAAALKHIFENSVPIGIGSGGTTTFDNFQEFFEYVKNHSTQVVDIMTSISDTMNSLPCYNSFNLVVSENFYSQTSFFESSVTQVESYENRLLDSHGNALSGVTMRWQNHSDPTIIYGECITDENGNYSFSYSRYSVDDANVQENAELALFSPNGEPIELDPSPELNYPPLPGDVFPIIDPEELPFAEESAAGLFIVPEVNDMFSGSTFTLFTIDSTLQTWLLAWNGGAGIKSLNDIRSLGDFVSIAYDTFSASETIMEQVERIQCYAEFTILTENMPLIDFLFDNSIKNLDTLIHTPVENLLALEADKAPTDDQFGDLLLSEIAETAAAVDEMLENTTLEWRTENE
jgi:hypothetical protein